jgi:hypothetical protein
MNPVRPETLRKARRPRMATKIFKLPFEIWQVADSLALP